MHPLLARGERGGSELAVAQGLLFHSHPIGSELLLPSSEGWGYSTAVRASPLEGLAPPSQASLEALGSWGHQPSGTALLRAPVPKSQLFLSESVAVPF